MSDTPQDHGVYVRSKKHCKRKNSQEKVIENRISSTVKKNLKEVFQYIKNKENKENTIGPVFNENGT